MDVIDSKPYSYVLLDDDGTESWRERYAGNGCKSLVADETGALRYVSGSSVIWASPDGTRERGEYYDAETESSSASTTAGSHAKPRSSSRAHWTGGREPP